MFQSGKLIEKARQFAQKNLDKVLDDTQVADYIAIIIAIKSIVLVFYFFLFLAIFFLLWFFSGGVLLPGSELFSNELLIITFVFLIFFFSSYLVYKEKLPVSKVRPTSVINAKHVEIACFAAVILGLLHPGVTDIKYLIYPANILVIYIMVIYLITYMVLLREINLSAVGVMFIASMSIYITAKGLSIFSFFN